MQDAAVSFAKRERASFIVFKEFQVADRETGPTAAGGLSALFVSGDEQRQPPILHFPAYNAALRSRYRQCVRKSLDKGTDLIEQLTVRKEEIRAFELVGQS